MFHPDSFQSASFSPTSWRFPDLPPAGPLREVLRLHSRILALLSLASPLTRP